ncbi:hypothetical protein J2S43_005487 [Catenuloplanes nepalensis]|uniref:Uncharacterized protein n=1 Tax=Catenuloplanes nepalensis TaxID=587533 RepID=A0ABT9MZV6_9ACTN|nr:hypothetical protein [Catenuloplanes nepalensis]MDP9796975.1 hypothetical protein [Catenuloplanes nepalensis]
MQIKKIVAGVALAGVATFGGFSMASPAMAGGGSTPALVDITGVNILNGNEVTLLQNVQIPVAAGLCGLNVNVLSQLIANNQISECSPSSSSTILNKVLFKNFKVQKH